MGRSGQQDGAPAAGVLGLLPALTPGRCCWPGGTTLFLLFHSPERRKKYLASEWPSIGFINVKRPTVQTGIPQSQSVLFHSRNATAKLTEATKHCVPSTANHRGWLVRSWHTVGRQYISAELNSTESMFQVCTGETRQKVRLDVFPASKTSPSFSTPRG